jgi:hypothetical protein
MVLVISFLFFFFFHGVLLRFALHSIDYAHFIIIVLLCLKAFACQSFAHQLTFEGIVCGRWAENGPLPIFAFSISILHFALHCILYFIGMLVFCSSADIQGHCLWQMDRKWSLLLVAFLFHSCLTSYSIFHWHTGLLLVSWHLRASFVADGQKITLLLFDFSGSFLCFALHCIVLYLFICILVFCSSADSFEWIICGRWAENSLCCFLLFLVCSYASPCILFLSFALILCVYL